jgi:hypothetical protein
MTPDSTTSKPRSCPLEGYWDCDFDHDAQPTLASTGGMVSTGSTVAMMSTGEWACSVERKPLAARGCSGTSRPEVPLLSCHAERTHPDGLTVVGSRTKACTMEPSCSPSDTSVCEASPSMIAPRCTAIRRETSMLRERASVYRKDFSVALAEKVWQRRSPQRSATITCSVEPQRGAIIEGDSVESNRRGRLSCIERRRERPGERHTHDVSDRHALQLCLQQRRQPASLKGLYYTAPHLTHGRPRGTYMTVLCSLQRVECFLLLRRSGPPFPPPLNPACTI